MPNRPLPTPEDISQHIQRAVIDDERTLSWLARKAGISDSTLRWQLENPARLTVANLLAIADALGWDGDQFALLGRAPTAVAS